MLGLILLLLVVGFVVAYEVWEGGGPPLTGDLIVALRWETHGTDVDLYVVDPLGQRHKAGNDLRSGPGEETCVIAHPMPGEYRIEAVYYDTAGGQETAVTVEAHRGDRAIGTYRAVLWPGSGTTLVHTVPVAGGAPRPEVAPRLQGSLSVTLSWQTAGTDVDLTVIGPTGLRHGPIRDVLRGPATETCVIRRVAPGPYRIEALYFNSAGGQHTVVTVTVRRGGTHIGTYSATLTREGQRRLVHTLRF